MGTCFRFQQFRYFDILMKPIVLIAMTRINDIPLWQLSHYPIFNLLTRYSSLNSFAESRIKPIGRRFGYPFSLVYSYLPLLSFSSRLPYSRHYRPGHFWRFGRFTFALAAISRYYLPSLPSSFGTEIASLRECASRAIP